jgi:YVTN family beta-propeller protein
MPKFSLIGPGYLGRSTNVNASRCVNFYPELNSQDSKNVTSLIGTPGTSLFTDTGLGIARGLHVFNGLIYIIAGNKLYSVNNAGVLSAALGSALATSNGRVVMADNGLSPTGGNQLAIADGVNIYIWDVGSSTFTSIVKTAFSICFLGGYFIADIGGAQWQVSGLYDGTSWSSLDTSTADATPDDLLAVFPNHGELWLLGEWSTEIWYQSGSGSPPFARMSGGVLDYGIAARYSVAKGNNTIFWLATQNNNGKGEFVGVGMASGYGVQIISTPAINYQISQYAVISDAFAYCYTSEGHEFYVLTFPTASATWAYDITTQLWHERSTYTDNPYAIGRHLSNCYANFNGHHYVGDYRNGKIYKMDSLTFKDVDDPIVSIRTATPINEEGNLNNLFIHKLQIDAETGTENTEVVATVLVNESNIALGNNPQCLAFGAGYIWVVNVDDNTITKIDPLNNTIIAIIGVGNAPYGIVFNNGFIYVTNIDDDSVSKINVTNNAVVNTIAVGSSPEGIATDGSYVWVSNYNDNTISKINSGDEVVAVIAGSNLQRVQCQQLLYYNGYLWAPTDTQTGGAAITKISVATDSIEDVIDMPMGAAASRGIIAAIGYIWNVNGNTPLDSITQVDPATDAVIDSFQTVSGAYGIAYGNGYLWLTSSANSEISIIDPVTKTIISTLAIGTFPEIVLYYNNFAWVTCEQSNLVAKVRVQTVIDPSSVSKTLLSWSVDGGHLWSNDHEASMGERGKYLTRLIWRRLGYSKDRIFRVAISNAIKKVLIAAHIDATEGTA